MCMLYSSRRNVTGVLTRWLLTAHQKRSCQTCIATGIKALFMLTGHCTSTLKM